MNHSGGKYRLLTLGATIVVATWCTVAAWCSPPQTGDVVIKVLVPQRNSAKDNFIIYPYPIKLPRNEKQLRPLPNTRKKLRDALLDSGYGGRVSPTKPNPPAGWRWRYIFQTAVAKSKLPLPKNVVAAYQWRDNILPYAIPELKKINWAEQKRIERYNKAVEFWDQNGVDLENEATRKKMGPIEIPLDDKFTSRGKLTPGQWWLVGTHRVAGLVFYWQEPFTVVPGYVNNVNLDEWNALVVQGDW